jgi:hypothetical protein
LKIDAAAIAAMTPQSAAGAGSVKMGDGDFTSMHMHIVPAHWICAGGVQATCGGAGWGARYSQKQPFGVHTIDQSGLQNSTDSFVFSLMVISYCGWGVWHRPPA